MMTRPAGSRLLLCTPRALHAYRMAGGVAATAAGLPTSTAQLSIAGTWGDVLPRHRRVWMLQLGILQPHAFHALTCADCQ